jgi:U4/U6 small nuclear ribonucleoprotein PRP3
MTGCAVITDDMALVVVEGGQKAQKRYNKLMLRRINWDQGRDEQDGDASM